jgi:lysophospholipase L1-like esterase
MLTRIRIAITAAHVAALLSAPARAQEPELKAVPKDPVSVVPVPRTDAGGKRREEELLRRAREEKGDVVFVGDSITQAWEGPGKQQWDKRFAPWNALNLGNSGDRTEHVLYRLEQAPLKRLHPEHIVLMIGTNNLGHGSSTAAETLLGIKRIVETLREQCPDAVVHVLEVFPRGDAINPMRGDIAQINQALRAYVRAAASPQQLRIHAIGDLFVEPDGEIRREIMPDALHLSPEGYTIWAEALAPLLRKQP